MASLDRMVPLFKWDHLPPHLQAVSRPFAELAERIADVDDPMVPPGPERTVALRKLLEAKDAAVRGVVFPG